MSEEKRTSSLKAMAADKDDPDVKKTDMFLVKPSRLIEEPGFNLRFEGEELEEHIEGITQHLMNGGTIPPLDVVVNSKGDVVVRDGHCRRRAILRAIERGVDIPFVRCLPFAGNDANQIVLMITRSMGRPLTVLETAVGYLRLFNLNWDKEMIAKHVERTTKHVEQMLVLAQANTDVHEMVCKNLVSATMAIEAVNSHGDMAGKVLAEGLEKAKASGKSKVTKATIAGPNVPKRVWTGVIASFDSFTAKLDNSTRLRLAELESLDQEQIKGKKVEIEAEALLELLKAQPALDEFRSRAAGAAAAGAQQSLEV